MNEPIPRVYACEEVREVVRLHKDLFTDEFRRLSIREQLDQQAHRMVEAHKAGDKAVVTHIQCWHPDLVGHSDQEIMAFEFTLDDDGPNERTRLHHLLKYGPVTLGRGIKCSHSRPRKARRLGLEPVLQPVKVVTGFELRKS